MKNVNEVLRCGGAAVLKYSASIPDMEGDGADIRAARAVLELICGNFRAALCGKIYRSLCDEYEADTDEKKRFYFPPLEVMLSAQSSVYSGLLLLTVSIRARRRGIADAEKKLGFCFDGEGNLRTANEVFRGCPREARGSLNFGVLDGVPQTFGKDFVKKVQNFGAILRAANRYGKNNII